MIIIKLLEQQIQKLNESTWSYSRLDTYKQCPFKFRLRYVDKIGSPFRNTLATSFGTLLHETEESIFNLIKDDKIDSIDYQEIKNTLEANFSELSEKFADSVYELDPTKRTYREKLNFYCDNSVTYLETLKKENPSLQFFAAEHKISCTIADRNFTGFIDRIFYDPTNDIYYLQDIKTWPSIKGHYQVNKLPLQFLIYTKALATELNIPTAKIVCQYYLPLDIDQVYVYSYNPWEDLTDNLQTVKVLFDSIMQSDFKPTLTPLCHWCEYCPTNPEFDDNFLGVCPYHSLWTRDSKNFKSIISWKAENDLLRDRELYFKFLPIYAKKEVH